MFQYLSRYTHRVAISNSRILSYDNQCVTFKWKDYRAKETERFKTLQLSADEFIRRFLIHILPHRFHRIRHFGLFANHQRQQKLNLIRQQVGQDTPPAEHRNGEVNDQEASGFDPTTTEPPCAFVCRVCGVALTVIDVLEPAHTIQPRGPPH